MPAATEQSERQNPRKRAAEADEPPSRTVAPALSRWSADPGIRSRLDDLLATAKGRQRALVLTHDNPDPDSIAAAMGLAFLLEERVGLATRVAFGGIIGRAENRALIKVLKLPLHPVARVDFDEFDLVALVDTQPVCTNHSLPPRGADVVIDHHPERETRHETPFADVGGDYGATASIVTSYLRASGLTLPKSLATALFYGIKSDTRDLGREFEPIDVDNYHWLFPQVDHGALSQIEHPTLPSSYFAAFHRAYGRARLHGDAVVVDVGRVYAPDIVAELADRLLSLEDVKWSLALGEYEGQLYFSVRTSDRRMNAGRLVRDLAETRNGSAGGHGSMAGGRLPVPEGTARQKLVFRQRLVGAFLREFGAPKRGERIV